MRLLLPILLFAAAANPYDIVIRNGRIVDGTPVVVFENGDFNRRRMRRLRLTQQDIMAAARQRGLMQLEQVRYAVAERDGKISIVEDQA